VTYGLFVWPCAPLLAKFVFHHRDSVAQKHILEVCDFLTLVYYNFAFSALMLLVGRQEGHPACKKYGGMVEVGTG